MHVNTGKKTDLGLIKICIGLFFFLNPLVSFADILPDFIGCLFLFSGLKPYLFLDARAQEARRTVKILTALSVARTLLTPVFFWSFSSADAGNTNLLLSFSFAVVTILLELSLVRALFDLFHYLAVRFDGDAGLNVMDSASSMLTIFLVVKNAASVLPDLLTLFSPDALLEYNPGSERAAAAFSFARNLAYGALAAAVLVFGVFCAVRLWRFFAAVRTDAAYLGRLSDAVLAADTDNPGLKVRFLFSSSLTLLTFAAVFSVDYYVDYVSVLPSVVAVILAFFVLRRLKDYIPLKRADVLLLSACALVCLGAYIYRAFFSKDVLFGVTFYTRPLSVVFGIAQAAALAFAFFLASSRASRAAKAAADIDLAPSKNAACAFCLINAGFSAYQYILPKGSLVTDLTESFTVFALVAGIVFCIFSWRIDSAFAKAAEWKTF